MSKETVTITSKHPALMPGERQFGFGTVKFDEEGKAEITKEQADTIRAIRNIHFSDQPDREVEAVKKEVPHENKVLETTDIGMKFDPPKGLGEDKVEASEDESVPAETEATEEVVEEGDSEEGDSEVDSDIKEQLSAMNITDLKDLCKESDLERKEWGNMRKEDLVDYIVEKKIL